MELWIRSQDRKNLIKVNALYTDIPDDFGKDGFGVYCDKRDSYISNTLLKIGIYKTKERTLEVLDEIQKILKPHLIIKDNGKIIGSFEDIIIRENATYELKELSTYVYEMPKE